MPEAAEVEIIRRGLERLDGQVLLDAHAEARLGLAGHEQEFVGHRVDEVLRRGKLLGLRFEERVIACHLRMTGNLSFGVHPQARAVLRFERDTLSFSDPRGFGILEAIELSDFAAKLGPDLFGLADGWMPEDRVRASRRAIKAVLLDQAVVAGIGNYLADEALWAARVHPALPAARVDSAVWKALYQQARRVARMTLDAGGVSLRDYVDTEGRSGTGQLQLKAYGRAGLPCERCGAAFEKTKVAGRGTTFCPACQELDSLLSGAPGP